MAIIFYVAFLVFSIMTSIRTWLAYENCRMQDHTVIEMAKFRNETVRSGGEVIDLKRVRGRR